MRGASRRRAQVIGWMRAAVVWLVIGAASGAAAGEPPFEIRNARGKPLSDRVTLGADGTAAWTYTAHVVVAVGSGEVDGAELQASLDPLEAEGGKRSGTDTTKAIPPTPVQGKLKPGAAADLTLQATFTAPGTYHGELLLVLKDAQRVVPVVVVVEAAPAAPPITDAPLTEYGKGIVRLTEGVWGGADATAFLRLRNTGATPVDVGVPQVVSARRVDKLPEPAREQQVGELTLAGDDGRKLPLQEPSLAAAPAVGTIPAGEVKKVDLTLRGFGGPGLYELQIYLPVKGHNPKVVTVTVARRRSVFWACVLIAAGVLLAYAVRWFVQTGKDGMTARRTLAEVRPQVLAVRDEGREPSLVAAAMVLLAEIEARDRDARWEADGATLLGTVKRLAERALLLGEVVAAARTLDRLSADAQAAVRKTLDEALVVVRVDPGKDKADEIDAQRRKVAALALDEVWRGELRSAVTELRASFDQLARSDDDAVKGTVKDVLRPALAKVEAALAGNQLREATDALDALRPTYLKVASGDLRRRLEDVPLGVDAGDWPRLRAPMLLALDRADAAGDWRGRRDAFVSAQRSYFREAIEALATYAEGRAASTTEPAADPARLTAIARELRGWLAAGDDGVDRAAREYGDRLAEVVRCARVKGRAREVAGGVLAALIPWLALPGEIERRGGSPRALSAVRVIDAKLTWTRWLVFAAVLVVAVASGVKALWLDDLAWGVDGDYLNAFLWGAGVGAVGDAFTGLIGLRAKLGGTPP